LDLEESKVIDYESIIAKYCDGNAELQSVLLTHSRQVADRALAILAEHPEWVESGEVGNAFTYSGRDFASYPVTVFDGWFRTVFAYALGFAFVAYQPALALLGRPDPLGLPVWAGYLSPLVALVAAVLATLVWRTGVRHYRSTGS
jgi:ABC-type uncharacterized transport system permease subunit